MFFYDLDKIVEKKIIKYCKGFSLKNIRILVAYSGGVDSSVLLHIVSLLSIKLGFKYDFIYINHNMNPQYREIFNISSKFSEINNCNFIYHKLKQGPEKNKESSLRKSRYDFFDQLKSEKGYDFVFTAHHYDDQIETLYMKTQGEYDWTNLLGIYSPKDYIKRPLLEVDKKKILQYAINNGVFWIFDDTNKNNSILRNNIRNLILPKMYFFQKYLLQIEYKYSKFRFYIFKFFLDRLKNKIIIKDAEFFVLKKRIFLMLNFQYRKLFLQSILKKYNNNNYLVDAKSKWNSLFMYLEKDKNLKDFVFQDFIRFNNSRDLIIVKRMQKYDKKIDLVNNSIWDNYIFKIQEVSCMDDKNVSENIFYVDLKTFKKGLFVRNWSIGDFYIDKKNKKKRVSKLFLKNKFNNYEKMSHPLIVDSDNQVLWIPELANGNVFLENNSCIKISKEILN